MKTKLLVFLTFFFTFLLSYGQSDSFKYLVLTQDQLQDIGFVFNEHGIFFRSELPKDKLNENYYITLGYYNNKYKNVETIPFFIKQSDGHFSSNNDLIFYLKATHSLIDKLAYVEKINEYIVK